MVSIRDVAKLANVSESTVSRVVNGNIPVEESTRRRVEAAILQLDYKPNLMAKGLRIKRSHLIGLVVPEVVQEAFASIIQHMEEVAVDRGYNLVLGNHKDDPRREEAFIDMLARRNVDGIIFTRVSDESRVMKFTQRAQVPVVVIDRVAERESLASVVLDNYKAGQLAGRHLASLGHRRIGCLTGPLNITLSRERLAGFRDALSSFGVELPEDALFEGDFKFEAGLVGARTLLERDPRITALWAQNDVMAVGALKYLQSAGRSVPAQVSLAGMDDIVLARMITPALTTVTQPFKTICGKAVEMLLALKEGHAPSVTRVAVAPGIMVRDSTAPPPTP